MMNEHFRQADFVSLPVPAGTKSGTPLRVGFLNAVTATDVAKTDVDATNTAYNWGGNNPHGYASCWLDGSYEFTVDFAVNAGDPIYITSANALTSTATGNTVFGHSLTTKAAATGPVRVRIAN